MQLPPCLQTPLLGAVLPHLIPSPRIRRRRCFSCPAPAPPAPSANLSAGGAVRALPLRPPPLPLTPPSIPFLLHRGHRARAASARTPASPGAPAARPGRPAPLGRLETSRRPRPDPRPRPEVAPAWRAAARGGGGVERPVRAREPQRFGLRGLRHLSASTPAVQARAPNRVVQQNPAPRPDLTARKQKGGPPPPGQPLHQEVAYVGFTSCLGSSALWAAWPAGRPLALPTVPSAGPARIRWGCLPSSHKQACFLQKNPDAVYATSPESQSTVLFKVI